MKLANGHALMTPGVIVDLSGAACRQLRRHIRLRTQETGGILTGKYAGQAVVITGATGPPRGSKAGRYHFERGDSRALLQRLWKSGSHYVGEWHYHPGSPTPSPQDHRSMRSLAGHDATRCPSPLLLVIGLENQELAFTMHVYLHGKKARTLTEIPT